MESALAFLSFVEEFPVTGAALLTLVVAGLIGIVRLIGSSVNERKKNLYIKPYYWGLSKNFIITTVLEYFPDPGPSGYRQEQYSRPDLWRNKVIKVSFAGLYHKLVPLNANDILVVNVRRKRKEKMVLFNRIL